MAHVRWVKLHAAVVAIVLFVGNVRADTTPVLVEVSVSSQELDASALRDAIGKELDCPVTISKDAVHSGEIVVKALSAGQVAVTFSTADRIAPLRRVVKLPQTPEHRVQLIVWLVGNMARNEAAEWLANHQREREAEAAKATPAPTNPTDAPSAESKPAVPADAKAKSDLSVGNAANKQQSNKSQNPLAGKVPAVEPSLAGSQPAPLTYHAFNLALWHPVELHRDAENSRFGFHLGLGYGHVGAIRGFGFDVLHHRSDVEVQGVASSLIWTRARRTQGVAWSLGVVTAKQQLRGVDYGGLVVYREGSVNGAQAAGLLTYANGDVVGAQFGAVNVAADVKGVQFGLVNVAKNVDGVAIGLVNISDNVRTQAELWAERNYLENIGVRYAYSTLTFGVSSGYDSANDRQRFLAGLGVRFTYKGFAFAPSVDVGFVIDKARTDPVGRGRENDVRLGFEWQLVPKVLGIAAGPTLALRSDSGRHLEPLPRWFAGLNLF